MNILNYDVEANGNYEEQNRSKKGMFGKIPQQFWKFQFDVQNILQKIFE